MKTKDITVEQARKVMIENGFISLFWHRDDIIQQAKDDDILLSEKLVDEVKEYLDDMDCDVGINWQVISVAIREVLDEYEEDIESFRNICQECKGKGVLKKLHEKDIDCPLCDGIGLVGDKKQKKNSNRVIPLL